MPFEEGVSGSILVSTTSSWRIVLQSAFQYLSPGPKTENKNTRNWPKLLLIIHFQILIVELVNIFLTKSISIYSVK